MKKEDVLSKLAAGELDVEEATKLLEKIEGQSKGTLECRVSQKGAVSVYGLRRFPVTLYAGEWEKLLKFGDEISKFIKEHDAELKRRDR